MDAAEQNADSEDTSSSDDEVTASASGTASSDETHPWPYLATMFAYVGKEDDSFLMKCLLCLPLNKSLKAYNNSPSNLKVHVKVSESSNSSQVVLCL